MYHHKRMQSTGHKTFHGLAYICAQGQSFHGVQLTAATDSVECVVQHDKAMKPSVFIEDRPSLPAAVFQVENVTVSHCGCIPLRRDLAADHEDPASVRGYRYVIRATALEKRGASHYWPQGTYL